MSEVITLHDSIPVIVICAPTACGKTDLVYNLFATSQHTPFAGAAEIVSADSMQVYRYMDIGTAKPDKNFQKELPHHLIDICEPSYQFGVGDFVRSARDAVIDISSRGKIPVIVGGTAFYIKNFVYGLPTTPKVEESVRIHVESRMQSEGAQVLWDDLNRLDPISAEKIHINDEYRIKRALEVCLSTGLPRSSFLLPQKPVKDYTFLFFCLDRLRQELYDRVEKRVEIMFEQGLEGEIDFLKAKGFTIDDPGMQAIGYKEFFTENSIDEIKAQIIKNTKEYVKRQQTFFKTFKEAEFINPENYDAIQRKIANFTCSST